MANEPITQNEEFMKAVDEIMTGNITPITREEILWAKVLGENVPDIVPVIRKEIFLAKIAGADIQTPKPITREEMYLDAIANDTELKLKPITRKEMFYAKALGLTDSAPEPVTRLEQILDQVEPSGGGTGGDGGSYDKYSWGGVFASIEKGTYATDYAIGDTVPLDLGVYGVHNMEIVAFDTDEKPDGTKAAITWLSKQIIAMHNMNDTNTNAGGWEASGMRSWLQNDVYNYLPADAKNAIATVKKTYYLYNKSTLTCDDTLWIPSSTEINGKNNYCENSDVTYKPHFTTTKEKVKYYNGTAANWWLRTAHNQSDQYFRAVHSSGGMDAGTASSNFGVVLGFCT